MKLPASPVGDPSAQLNFEFLQKYLGYVRPPAYLTTTLPPATSVPDGAIVYVSNAAAGSKFQGNAAGTWVPLG